MKLTTRYELPKLIQEYKLTTGVEVGTEAAVYSYYLLKHSKLSKLYSIDPWRNWPNGKSEAEAILKNFGQRSKILHMTSLQGAEWIKQNNVKPDLIYIDGSHKVRDVRDDIAAWWPLLAENGFICFHDYLLPEHGKGGEGVVAAVNEFLSANKHLQLWLTDDFLKTAIIQKPKIVK